MEKVGPVDEIIGKGNQGPIETSNSDKGTRPSV